MAAVSLVTGFAVSFGDARAVYGMFAAVHAWVEIPVLVAAVAVRAPAAAASVRAV